MSQKPVKPPTSKLVRPTGLPPARTSPVLVTPGSQDRTGSPSQGLGAQGSPQHASKAQAALEKSARAAGLTASSAEQYAARLLHSDAANAFPPTAPAPYDPCDDLKIGDRVYIAGVKPGIIAFIGDVQFSAGEWAGVVLDTPDGKNDGTVAGVRYFQCEPRRGIFSRLAKLSKELRPPGSMSGGTSASSGSTDGSLDRVGRVGGGAKGEVMKRFEQDIGLAAPPAGGPTRWGVDSGTAADRMSSSDRSARAGISSLEVAGGESTTQISERLASGVSSREALDGGVDVEAAAFLSDRPDSAVPYRPYSDLSNRPDSAVPDRPDSGLPDRPDSDMPNIPDSARPDSGLPDSDMPDRPDSSLPDRPDSSLPDRPDSALPDRPDSAAITAALASLERSLPLRSVPSDPVFDETVRNPLAMEIVGTPQGPERAGVPNRNYPATDASLSAAAILSHSLMASPLSGSNSMILMADAKRAVTPSSRVSHLPRRTSVGSGHSSQQGSPMGGSVGDIPSAGTICEVGGREGRGLVVGDRVRISGSKAGVLRYLGVADFAKGQWAGVELEGPLGKNDGSVAGKRWAWERYFACAPLHGLFAPLHKVELLYPPAPGGGAARVESVSRERPSFKSRSAGGGAGGRELRAMGSQDSISSIGSAASSASRGGGRMRLGITSLAGNQANKARPQSMSPNLAALQKALKEKEEHVEQLLRERDLERSEFAQIAARIDELETENSSLRLERARVTPKDDVNEELVQRLRLAVERAEKKSAELQHQLREEKRKYEDLQFTLEEAQIEKAEHETRAESDARRIGELEEQLGRAQAALLNNDRHSASPPVPAPAPAPVPVPLPARLPAPVSASGTTLTAETEEYLMDQIEELTHKLSVAENQIKTLNADVAAAADATAAAVAAAAADATAAAIAATASAASLSAGESVSTSSIKDQAAARSASGSSKCKVSVSKGSKLPVSREKSCSPLRMHRENNVERIRQLESELVDMKARSSRLVADKDHLVKEKAALMRVQEEREIVIRDLRAKLEQAVTAASRASPVPERDAKPARLSAAPLEGSDEVVAHIASLQEERDLLRVELDLRRATVLDPPPSEGMGTSFKDQYEDLQAKYTMAVKNWDVERQAILQVAQNGLKERENEILTLKQAIEEGAVDTLQWDENRLLQQRIRQLEHALSEANANLDPSARLGANGSLSLTDKAAAESQITFLNSVIVDLQRKNREQEVRLEALDPRRVLTARHGPDRNLNNSSSANGTASARVTAPRLFCDICDTFDTHDTDDCPQQGASSDTATSSRHGGSRTDVRPYCTTCEVFGHTTDKCADDQTF